VASIYILLDGHYVGSGEIMLIAPKDGVPVAGLADTACRSRDWPISKNPAWISCTR
jgi:hypothetical protein